MPNPHPFIPSWIAWLILCALVGAAVAIGFWVRRSAIRTWEKFAKQIGGEFRAKDSLSPAVVTGTLRSRPFLLETNTSHEDDAPYYHTRGAFPVKNPAGFILGVRRKSLLEEAQTRRQPAPFDLHDPDFEKRFFVLCNDAESLPLVLTPEIRRELGRYHDVEIYVRLSEIEWRRAGEQNELRTIERLTEALADMAEAIDVLPSRTRKLSERLADEALIARGI